jgi:hypothetical protein
MRPCVTFANVLGTFLVWLVPMEGIVKVMLLRSLMDGVYVYHRSSMDKVVQ